MSGSNGFISNLTQAARDNPLAAALIGAGAAWLLLSNGRRIGAAANSAMDAARPLAEAGRRAASDPSHAVAQAASGAAEMTRRSTEAARDVAHTMARTANDAVAAAPSAVRDYMEEARERASQSVDQTKETLRSTNDSLSQLHNPLSQLQQGCAMAQSAVGNLLERQPLALGALGLAIGAGIAGAISSASHENGQQGATMEDIEDTLDKARDTAGAGS